MSIKSIKDTVVSKFLALWVTPRGKLIVIGSAAAVVAAVLAKVL